MRFAKPIRSFCFAAVGAVLSGMTGCALDPLPPVARVRVAAPSPTRRPGALPVLSIAAIPRAPSRLTVDDMNCFYAYARGAGIGATYSAADLDGYDGVCLHADGQASLLVDIAAVTAGEDFTIATGPSRSLGLVGVYSGTGASCAGQSFASLFIPHAQYALYPVAELVTDITSSATYTLDRALDTSKNLHTLCAPPPGSGQPPLVVTLAGDSGAYNAIGASFTDGTNASGYPLSDSGSPMQPTMQGSLPPGGILVTQSTAQSFWHPRQDFLFDLDAVNTQGLSSATISITGSTASRQYTAGSGCSNNSGSGGTGGFGAAIFDSNLGTGTGWRMLNPVGAGVSQGTFPLSMSKSVENGGRHYIHVSARSDRPADPGYCSDLTITAVSVTLN